MSTTAEGDSPIHGTNQSGDSDAAVGANFKPLFDGVDDLIKRVADIESAEVQKIRAKVRVALMVAKSALHDSASQARRRALQVASTADGYVHDFPWQSIGAAGLMGMMVGMLIGGRDQGSTRG